MPTPPYEWVISTVAEAFGCTPSRAEHELDRDPDLVMRILDMRAFVRAGELVQRATQWSELTLTPHVQTYMQIEYSVMKEAMKARR